MLKTLSIALLIIPAISATSGCADPSARLDDFSERVVDAGTDRADAELLDDIPNVTGEFLLALDPAPFPGTYFRFLATTELVKGDRGTSTLTLSLQPLHVETGEAVGDALVPDGSPLEVSMTGEFSGHIAGDVAGEANPVSGTALTVDITMEGILRSGGFFCGSVDGGVTAPFTLALDGSTFGSVRIPDETAMNDVTPVGSCAGDPTNAE